MSENRKTPTIRFAGGTDLPAGRRLGTAKSGGYVLLCDDGSLYKGKTNNLECGMKEHFSGVGGANHTQKHKPRKLVHLEAFEAEKEAVDRENFLRAEVAENGYNNK